MKEKHPIVKAIAQFIFLIGRLILRLRYRVKIRHKSCIDKNRPVLFLPNHQAVVDPMILVSFLYPHKKVVPVVTSTYYDLPILNRFFKNWGAVRVSDLEAGSRNVNVLQDITKATSFAFKHNKSIVIYPSGQISNQGYERILNKKSAYEIVKQMPDDVQIVGVKINGLWGSMWSKAWNGKSPKFLPSVLKGILYTLANFIFFMPRRNVYISFTDITNECKNIAGSKTRSEFNKFLEEFYNQHRSEDPIFTKNFFYHDSSKRRELYNQEKVDKIQNTNGYPTVFPIAIGKGVNKIIADKLELNKDEIFQDSHLINDLGADSLSMVEIISSIEQQFRIDKVSDISNFKLVKDLYLLANGNLQKQVKLPPCTFTHKSPYCDFVKIRSLDNIPTQFIQRFTSHKHLEFAYDSLLGESTREGFLLKVCVVSEIIKKKCKSERVGIMLPALQSTSLLIMSCYLAGKIPVMLNWTVGHKILEHCIKETGLKQIFTASAFADRINDQLPESVKSKLLMMDKEVAKASLTTKLRGALKSKFPKVLINTQNVSETAVILFTSGSENLPKAVPLSHSNIVNDLKGTLETVDFNRNEILMAFLPPFHSFGFTVLSILPLITGIRTVYFPDPTDGKGIVRMIQHTSASLLVAAPSFLKIILTNAEPRELRSLSYVVSGAEALSNDVKRLFDQFVPQATILEGYGITECSPVLTLNPLQKQKERSVGKVIKGLKCKIVSLENDEELEAGQEGMICFKGKNIFSGYLNGSIESPFININGKKYYKTGDVGYMDNEGYIFLTGRLKRFIKNAGEMISLPFLENILLEEFGEEDETVLAVVGNDEVSPPEIVLFATKPIGLSEANECLKKNNAPTIAKISKVERLDTIPLLGTGKVDYRLLSDFTYAH